MSSWVLVYHTLWQLGKSDCSSLEDVRAGCDFHGHGKMSYAPHENTIVLVLHVSGPRLCSIPCQVKLRAVSYVWNPFQCWMYGIPQFCEPSAMWKSVRNSSDTVCVMKKLLAVLLFFIHCLLLRWACKVNCSFRFMIYICKFDLQSHLQFGPPTLDLAALRQLILIT